MSDKITIDDFAKIELRVGLVKVAERVPKADKLLRLEIDDREVTLFLKTNDTPLQIVVKSPDYEYAMRFLRYEPDRKPDKSQFQLPPGVQLKK